MINREMSKLVFLGINFIVGVRLYLFLKSIVIDIFRLKHVTYFILTTLTHSPTSLKLEKLKKVIINV